MLPNNIINVAEIGIKPTNTGAANSAAASLAQAPLKLPPQKSQRWLFDGGEYQFDDTFHIRRPLWLEGIGGSYQHPRTQFKFPAGKHGLYFHGPGILTDDAQGAAAINIRITALPPVRDNELWTVAHGVVVEGMCFLSHMLIEAFLGDGIHALARLPATNAGLSRFDSVSAVNNGYVVHITSMSRSGPNLTINTNGPHHLQVNDLFWLESKNPDVNFPRGVCSVTAVSPGNNRFDAQHPIDTLTGAPTATGSYSVVIGNGIYTHGDDANNMNCFACTFTGNFGWGVLEDSFLGNAYWGCNTSSNGVGAYYANNASGLGNVFIGCYSEEDQLASVIGSPAIVIGGDHGAPLTGSGLFLVHETSTQLAFKNGSGGKVTLGSRDPGSTRYLAFENTQDGLDANQQLSIDFDQAAGYQKMLGFGQSGNRRSPAFLISGPSGFHEGWGKPIEPGRLVINDMYWLGFTRHETVIQVPDAKLSGDPTWNIGDRAWNRFVNPSAPAGVGTGAYGNEGWICTGGTYVNSATPPDTFPLKGGTLGEYKEPPGSEPCTARTDGTKTVVLNKPSSVLKPGMFLVINDTPSSIISISPDGATLTMNDVIPPGGPGLPIKFNPPDFHKFGSIALLPDLPPPPPGSPPPPPPVLLRANLPDPAIAGAGARGCVSDANATVFGAVVAGGGTNFVPVYCDGTNWRIG